MRQVGAELFRADGRLTVAFLQFRECALKMLPQIYTVTAQKSTPERLKDPSPSSLSANDSKASN